VDIQVEPDDEIGPRLRSLGIDPTKDLKSLVLSHLHHDHADGLGHFETTDIVVSEENLAAARPRITGSLLGAVPGQWPSWFAPRRVNLDGPPARLFDRSYPLTPDGTVFAVPTPGHMVGHMSVVVRTPEATYFLVGERRHRGRACSPAWWRRSGGRGPRPFPHRLHHQGAFECAGALSTAFPADHTRPAGRYHTVRAGA
jgi:hypothetical protein